MRFQLTVVVLALVLAPGFAHAAAPCIPGSQSTVFNASHDLDKVSVNGRRYANLQPDEVERFRAGPECGHRLCRRESRLPAAHTRQRQL